jgi:chemotaxis protein methyltransferase CheR
MSFSLSDSTFSRISDRIAELYGFNVTSSRWTDLEMVLEKTALEDGCTTEVLSQAILDGTIAPKKLDFIISHLTIGETYFLRHPDQFLAVEELFLKRMIDARRANGKRALNLWSVACSTGEEAYSLGILVSRLIPDIQSWDVKIFGTDINESSLEIARKGEYGSWSFRGVDQSIKNNYFTSLPKDKFLVADSIRNLVSFSRLNLISQSWNLPHRCINSIDVIFCRNVLIYFSRISAHKILERISHYLSDSGCLVVAPSEISYIKTELLQPVRHAGTTIFSIRKRGSTTPLIKPDNPAAHQIRKPKKPAEFSKPTKSQFIPETPALTHERAGHAQHYLVASVALESGKFDEARKALTSTLFLKPDFIPALLSLGNISLQEGRREEAIRHFITAEKALNSMDPESIVPGSEGMSAKGLLEIVRALLKGAEG